MVDCSTDDRYELLADDESNKYMMIYKSHKEVIHAKNSKEANKKAVKILSMLDRIDNASI